MQIISPLLTMPFLSSSLSFALVYIWSRRNPSIKMSLFGVIKAYVMCEASPRWKMMNDFGIG